MPRSSNRKPNCVTYRFSVFLDDVLRVLDIHVTSTWDGYTARVTEQLHGGGGCAVALRRPYGPREEFDAASFYPYRKNHRDQFLAQLEDEISAGRFAVLTRDLGEVELALQDCYRRVNLIRWPQGYPKMSDDDLSDLTERQTTGAR